MLDLLFSLILTHLNKFNFSIGLIFFWSIFRIEWLISLIVSQEVPTEYSSASIFNWFTIILIVGAIYIYSNLWKIIGKYEWKIRPIAEWDGFDFENKLNTFSKDFSFRYKGDQIPLQRALFFTNGTDLAQIDENFPIIFHAELDKGEMSFQEYGFLVSTVEIVIKKKGAKINKANNELLQYFLPFYELCAVKKVILP